MPQVRDLFFDKFYEELVRVVSGIAPQEERSSEPSILADEIRRCWCLYISNPEQRDEALISIDGGVQLSRFAYGRFVTVGRALAHVHQPPV